MQQATESPNAGEFSWEAVKYVRVARSAGPSKRRTQGVVKLASNNKYSYAVLELRHMPTKAQPHNVQGAGNVHGPAKIACESPVQSGSSGLYSSSTATISRNLYISDDAQISMDRHAQAKRGVPKRKRSSRIPLPHAQLLLYFYSSVNAQAATGHADAEL